MNNVLTSKEDFKSYLEGNIRKYLPEEFDKYSIRFETISKNNGVVCDALVLLEPNADDSEIGMNFYWDKYFDRCCRNEICINEAVAEFAEWMISTYKKNHNEHIECANFAKSIKSYDTCKENIFPKAICASINKELLESVPHTIEGDLAFVYIVRMPSVNSGMYSVTVNNHILSMWGLSDEEIYNQALENLRKSSEIRLKPFGPFYCLTNESCVLGASAIFDPEIRNAISEKFGGKGYVIIPSSIHEVLIMGYNAGIPAEDYYQMIAEVNSTEVDKQEILSFAPHCYNEITGKIEIFGEDELFQAASKLS